MILQLLQNFRRAAKTLVAKSHVLAHLSFEGMTYCETIYPKYIGVQIAKSHVGTNFCPLGLNQYYAEDKCIAQGYNTLTPRLKPVTHRSQVQYSTTEPLLSSPIVQKLKPFAPRRKSANRLKV